MSEDVKTDKRIVRVPLNHPDGRWFMPTARFVASSVAFSVLVLVFQILMNQGLDWEEITNPMIYAGIFLFFNRSYALTNTKEIIP